MLSVASVGNPTDFHKQGRKDEASFGVIRTLLY